MRQVLQEMQQAVEQLRQTVNSWNDQYEQDQEQEQQVGQNELGKIEHDEQGQVEETNEIIHDDVSTVTSSQINPPPGLHSSGSGLGSASTIIMSTLKMPLFKGGKRGFVCDANLFGCPRPRSEMCHLPCFRGKTLRGCPRCLHGCPRAIMVSFSCFQKSFRNPALKIQNCGPSDQSLTKTIPCQG